MFKGRTEASSPDVTTWRTVGFNDVAFADAPAPFSYGEGYTTGTVLTDMINDYTCFFLRRAFTVTNVANIAAFRLGAKVDDGFVIWINGTEVQRVNMPEPPGSPVTRTNLSSGAPSEPVPFVFYTFSAPASLVSGSNIVAVQVFNVNAPSTDIVFDCSLDAILTDTNPPVIVGVSPAPGTVSSLTQITVTFSEPVNGVNAEDLTINTISATGLTGSGSNYTFTFAAPALYGGVNVAWVTNHEITDLAVPGNAFDGTAPGATWQYNYIDTVAPTVAGLFPAAGTTVRVLGEVRVTFSEGVAGLEAADLRLNGVPATNVISQAGSVYVFQFPPAGAGFAQLAWAAGHGIADLAAPPNAFAGGTWSYLVDPNVSFADLVINEILVSPTTGLNDPIATGGDTDALPWIELHNRGTNSIDLAGWSLSDDPDFPNRWVFPAKTIGPGQYLIVFASGLNITNATGTNRLHTNFKLTRMGEFLGLYSPDSPPVLVSSFSPQYPEQRNDYSFGRDAQENLRYFATPTPGAANGNSAITGVVAPVHFAVERGHFTQPFDLVLTCPTRGTQIRYTTNGSEPTLTTGLPYNGPVRIANTALIRAVAFRSDMLPSFVRTHTYLFNLPTAQRSLPVISIVTDQNNLTGQSGIIGINGGSYVNGVWTAGTGGTNDYHNPSKHGIAWERPTSVEFLQLPDNSGFQADAGIRVQGSDYQRPRTTPTSKFSYRLYFRGVYGGGRLHYPLFPLAASEEFDQIVLRAGFNENANPFIRDELTRRLSHDMGNVASHGNLVSMFVNGVYKGFYNPCERVHEEFMQSYLGGSDDWDVVGPSFATGAGVPGVIDGDRNNFVSLVNYVASANMNDPAIYAEVGRRLDLVNFADYCLLNAYAGMGDWPQNNWRAGKDRAAYPWRFIVWDAEWAMGIYGRAVTLNTFTMNGPGPDLGGLASTSDSEIARMYQALRASPEFRLLWADRVHKHMFNGGALTDANITNRFGEMRTEMAGVFAMVTDIITGWVPARRTNLFNYMVPFNLIASSNAPVFNQFGGRVAPGFQLTMVATNGGGTIYYTTNGADPRVPFSGAVSNAALAYSGPIALDRNVLIKARTLGPAGWSALTEASFQISLLGIPIRITEIHYNPADSPNYEFIELMNIGGAPVDLSGATFDGITFTFGLGSIVQPGARIVLATDLNTNAFAARYPGVAVTGYYNGSLNNGGERIVLIDVHGNIITSLDYDDGGIWLTGADGSGPSLEMIDPFGDPDDPVNWRASGVAGGTPGSVSPPAGGGLVRLNEVLADNAGAVNHAGTFPDFIELLNNGGTPADLSGWSLTDDASARKFVFPPGTSIAAGGYLVVWCDTVNTTPGLHSGFALGRNGQNVFLYDPNTNRVDALTFGLQIPNYSVGRVSGTWVLTTPTTNAANVAAPLGSAADLSINEFLANPLPGLSDWLELFNNSALPVALRGSFLATTTAVHQVTSLSFIAPFGFAQFVADEGVGPDRLDFRLPAVGGAIVLSDATGTEVNRVTYSAQTEGVSRGRLPDGSATLANFPGTASPGASNYTATYSGPVLNEVLARNVSAVTNAGRVADYVELFNSGGSAFSLAGMSLSVNSAEAGQWVFPPDATIPAQGFLVVWCDGGMPVSTNSGNYNTGQSLDGESGGAYLFNAAGQLVNSVEYGFQVADRSIGLVGGTWRLLASPTPGAANSAAAALGPNTALRLNEWMAQSADGPDWFELFNSTNLPVDMASLVLTDDPTASGTNEFRVPALSFIGANGFVQWLADSSPDQGRHHVNFDLDAQGESIRLYATNGITVIDTVAFGAQSLGVSQGRIPDGATSMASFPGSDTPAESNYRLIPGTVINEVLTHTTSASSEQGIELHNTTGQAIDVSGWFLSNDAAVAKKFRIPDGIILPANGYYWFNQAQFNSGPNAFLLDRARGGEVWLSAADPAGNLSGFRSRVKFGAAAPLVSFGRFEVAGQSEFVAQVVSTLGSMNGNPRVGPVVINEILFNPTNNPAATEFIELKNIDGAPQDLSGWQLNDGVSFAFPSGTTLQPGNYLLVVEFDPVAAPAQLASFRAFYGVSPSVAVFGPYSGKLDNNGETIELSKPDLPDGAFIPLVLVDKVNYRDSAPWPGGATDGGGSSLQRRTANAYGNNPANWLAAAPTAGNANATSAATPPVIVQSPASTNALVNTDLLLQAVASGAGPLSWQWRFNGVELAGATNSSLFIDHLQLGDSGAYDAYVSNPGGPAFSAAAQVLIVEPPLIFAAPPNYITTNGGSNITFTVSVGGTPPLRYQWQFDGVDLPGATASSLSLTNVVISQSGVYTLVASNAYGVAATNFTFVALVRPAFVIQPQAQTVLQGGTAVFSALATPNHPLAPLYYRWIRNGVGVQTSTVPMIVFTNVQLGIPNPVPIRCAVTNLASGVGGVNSFTVNMTVLADFDRDGMADSWEALYGFNTNSVADATLDLDGDGMINRDEYGAGTNPTDPSSLLKLTFTTTNAAVLEFVAQVNLNYAVQYRTNLSTALWNNLTNIGTQSTVRAVQVNVPQPSPERERYYRIATPPPVP